jgi:hypothetical protein
MFRGLARNAGHPLHSPAAPLLPLPRVAVCHAILIVLYKSLIFVTGKRNVYLKWSLYVITNSVKQSPSCILITNRVKETPPGFMEAEGVSPCSRETNTVVCPTPNKPTPHLPTHLSLTYISILISHPHMFLYARSQNCNKRQLASSCLSVCLPACLSVCLWQVAKIIKDVIEDPRKGRFTSYGTTRQRHDTTATQHDKNQRAFIMYRQLTDRQNILFYGYQRHCLCR